MTAKEIFAALAAPFPDDQVKTRVADKSGRKLSYITARTARSRLNTVIGPENWECFVEASEKWVKCTILITLPEGRTVSRSAIGGYPNMPSEEDKVKGGDSDAFKRACALFGVGEYLYGDELSDYEDRKAQAPADPPRADSSSLPTTKREVNSTFVGGHSSGWPKAGNQFYPWIMKIKERYNWDNIVFDILNLYGPKSNYRYPSSFKEWTPDEVNAVALYVAHRVSEDVNYRGEFDKQLGGDH